jgi:hypothetical protein
MAVVYATFSTWVTPTVQIERGEIWDADDPVVASHPDWFTDDPTAFARRSAADVYNADNAHSGRVEQATAVPGEKRALSKTDQAFDEAESLREELEKADVKVDGRWGLDRLREEYAKVTEE